MSWKIKLDAADRVFSLYIRIRDGRCMRCGRLGRPNKDGHPVIGLQCSHYHGRRKEATRYDPENCDAICAGCHQYFDENRDEYTAMKKLKLGERAFNMLKLRSQSYCKKDRKMAKLKCDIMLKKLLKEKRLAK
jgi:hypothetical protein